MMSSSQTIKKIRLSLCLDQKEFAEKLELSTSTICGYERGYRTPRLPIIRKLLEIAKKNGMKLSIDDFINDQEKDFK